MEQPWILYHNLKQDPVVLAVLNKETDVAIRQLVVYGEEKQVSGDVWLHYLCRQLAGDENVFSRTVELTGMCGVSLIAWAQNDLASIRSFALAHADLLPDYKPTQETDSESENGTGLLHKRPGENPAYTESIGQMVQAMRDGNKAWFQSLIDHYRTLGRGVSARYSAMEWSDRKGSLTGIKDPDRIQLEDLIGIEHQKEVLIENTERFLRGAGANNVLLFGDSGTGKSSCVKALVNRYVDDGLRLVELGKDQLSAMELVLDRLSESRHRFIIFMDDLSFEEGELGYKHLKAALEGKASVTPENVLYYATSNRRHLIRESWADRVTAQEDVHISDTMQEKLSLSERFGLRVIFPSPSQKVYLEIVESYLQKRGIAFTESLRQQAIQWEMTYNGRSGRTARQFVRSLE